MRPRQTPLRRTLLRASPHRASFRTVRKRRKHTHHRCWPNGKCRTPSRSRAPAVNRTLVALDARAVQGKGAPSPPVSQFESAYPCLKRPFQSKTTATELKSERLPSTVSTHAFWTRQTTPASSIIQRLLDPCSQPGIDLL